MKIAFIGAGSLGFTRKLVLDILKVQELQDVEFALHDVDSNNLDMIATILQNDVAANKLPTRISRSLDRRQALDGARYVINCARVGGLEAFAHDIRIPLKYGVDQCVGDTICAGGIMYGQRSIPQMLAFCRDIRTVSESDALLLNYANPMAMNTWAAIDHGGIQTIGLCHGVQNGWRQIADVLGASDPNEVELVAAGINHQTWFVDIRLNGREVSAAELLNAFEAHPRYAQEEKVRIDVLRRFGCYSTESNGHLSEYLPWYRKRPDEIDRWIDTSDWINGETGGYLRVCTERRNWFEEDYPELLKQSGKPLELHERSDEHGSHIIEALETGRSYRGHFNTKNTGLICNLPDDCIVETVGVVDRFGLNMAAGIALPDACAAICQASISVQRLGVRAAIEGDIDLLRQAMMLDPLVGAVCNPDEVWDMTDELLVAEARWLPQYAHAIDAAARQLAIPRSKPLVA